eukprot:2908804-Rhodomonas_salina.1
MALLPPRRESAPRPGHAEREQLQVHFSLGVRISGVAAAAPASPSGCTHRHAPRTITRGGAVTAFIPPPDNLGPATPRVTRRTKTSNTEIESTPQ